MTTASKPRPNIVHGESHSYPVLPLRDIVVFPHMIVPLFVGREKSIRALEEVMRSDKQILLAAQKNAGDDDPSPDAIYEIGTRNLQLSPASNADDATTRAFEAGLIAARARAGLFAERPGGVQISRGVLYSARIALPAAVPVEVRHTPRPPVVRA